jgi:multimeric flavodoxin WrbA
MVLYYSMFGNTYLMAKAVSEGIQSEGGETLLRTVTELVPQAVIKRAGHHTARQPLWALRLIRHRRILT